MKKQLLSIILIAFSTLIMAQKYATNFTCNDCSGTPHELFKDLDSGKIIVLVWVMPCGACTGPAITSYNIVKSYQATNPNKVYFYLADDLGDTNCASLGSWCTSNGLDLATYSSRFSNAVVKMSNYGSAGMPKIVVLAGSEHKILYNINNTVSSKDLQNAINTALVITSTTDHLNNDTSLSVSPNPASESVVITYSAVEIVNGRMELLNADGKLMKTVYSGKLITGENKFNFKVTDYHPGIYYIKLSTGGKIKSAKFTIVR